MYFKLNMESINTYVLFIITVSSWPASKCFKSVIKLLKKPSQFSTWLYCNMRAGVKPVASVCMLPCPNLGMNSSLCSSQMSSVAAFECPWILSQRVVALYS